MRSVLQQRTPVQLLWIQAVATILIVLGFGVPVALSWHTPVGQHLPFSLRLPWFAAILIGFTVSLLAEDILRNGVSSERWSDSLLATPRRLVAHSAYSILGWSLLFAVALTAIFVPIRHASGLVWAYLVPQMSLVRVHMILRSKPSETFDLQRITLDSAKPLYSHHWGGRRSSVD